MSRRRRRAAGTGDPIFGSRDPAVCPPRRDQKARRGLATHTPFLMKTIIAGSRDITLPSLLDRAIAESGFEITEVLCGRATGVDELGRRWAIFRNIPVRFFPADWSKYGKSAGPRRNAEMARNAEALVAVTYGSRGTANMIQQAREFGLRIHILEVPRHTLTL